MKPYVTRASNQAPNRQKTAQNHPEIHGGEARVPAAHPDRLGKQPAHPARLRPDSTHAAPGGDGEELIEVSLNQNEHAILSAAADREGRTPEQQLRHSGIMHAMSILPYDWRARQREQAANAETAPTVFDFNQQAVRIVVRDGEPWFVVADVCWVLGLANPTEAIRGLDDDEKMTLSTTEGHSGTRGGAQSLNIISESGLYALIFKSRKPQAREFRKWVTNVVLPQIRKTGRYETETPKPKAKPLRSNTSKERRTAILRDMGIADPGMVKAIIGGGSDPIKQASRFLRFMLSDVITNGMTEVSRDSLVFTTAYLVANRK